VDANSISGSFSLIATSFQVKVKNGKGKVRSRTDHEGEIEVYFYSFLNLGTREGWWWLTPRPYGFTTGKDTRYPLYRRLGGPQDRCGKSRTHRDSVSGPSNA
jgi:hypothetical protein